MTRPGHGAQNILKALGRGSCRARGGAGAPNAPEPRDHWGTPSPQRGRLSPGPSRRQREPSRDRTAAWQGHLPTQASRALEPPLPGAISRERRRTRACRGLFGRASRESPCAVRWAPPCRARSRERPGAISGAAAEPQTGPHRHRDWLTAAPPPLAARSPGLPQRRRPFKLQTPGEGARALGPIPHRQRSDAEAAAAGARGPSEDRTARGAGNRGLTPDPAAGGPAASWAGSAAWAAAPLPPPWPPCASPGPEGSIGGPRPAARPRALRLLPWPRRGQAPLPRAWRCPALAPPAPAPPLVPRWRRAEAPGGSGCGLRALRDGAGSEGLGKERGGRAATAGRHRWASLFLGNGIRCARSCQERAEILAGDLPADGRVVLGGELPFWGVGVLPKVSWCFSKTQHAKRFGLSFIGFLKHNFENGTLLNLLYVIHM